MQDPITFISKILYYIWNFIKYLYFTVYGKILPSTCAVRCPESGINAIMLKSEWYGYHISLKAVIFVSHAVIWGEYFPSNPEMWLPEVLAKSCTVREKLHWALVIKCLYLSPWTQTSNQSQTKAPNFPKIMLLEALKSVTDRLSSFLSCQLVLYIAL